MPDKCPRCEKPVYFAEQAKANGKSWHKPCLTCKHCNKRLDSTNLTNKDDEIYCKSCYGKAFGPKGYGFGGGAGTLSMDTGKRGEIPCTAPLIPNPLTIGGPCVPGGCPRCGKRVYDPEKQASSGQVWHAMCFKCKECNHRLDSTTVNDHEREIYCNSCYKKLFCIKGFGFGIGAGALNFTQ
ncbi:cysteine and glycine-rich protein 1 [Nematostella vectensis]